MYISSIDKHGSMDKPLFGMEKFPGSIPDISR